jgi:hypothetical protein
MSSVARQSSARVPAAHTAANPPKTDISQLIEQKDKL